MSSNPSVKNNFRLHICALFKIILVGSFFIFSSCDSGEKVIDKATGREDVNQYQKMKKDIGKIAEQQAGRYKQIPDESEK